MNVDGRWKGEWELTIEENGRASGTYRSDETQSNYPVTGRITGQPHHMKLQIQFDNAVLDLDAFLWTKDKSAMAGTATLAERTFGFFAVRAEAE